MHAAIFEFKEQFENFGRCNFANGAQPDCLMGKAQNPFKFAECDFRAPFALQLRQIFIGNSSKRVSRRCFDGALGFFFRLRRINACRQQSARIVAGFARARC